MVFLCTSILIYCLVCSTSQSNNTLNCTSITRKVVISPAVCIDVVDVCDNTVIVYAMLAYGVLKGDCERVANEKSHEDNITLRYIFCSICVFLHFHIVHGY